MNNPELSVETLLPHQGTGGRGTAPERARERTQGAPERNPGNTPRSTPEGTPEFTARKFSALTFATSGTFFLIYLALSARRHAANLSTGYDLGIFTQVVQSYANGTAPYSALKGPDYNTLGDHFHPILAVLAPAYRLFPSGFTLLVCQAALVAFSIAPLMKWAYEVRGRGFALWVGISYGASWGLAKLVSFDFHEVAFAVPFLSLSLCAAGRRNWRAAALWAMPLVLVKEDLGLTVAAIGAYLAWKGARTTGIALAVFGVAATALEMLVILPYFNPLGQFAYWPPEASEEAGLLLQAVGVLWPPVKWLTVLMLVAPTGFLALRSPILLVALPTLGWRFVSSNPYYWGTDFHYSAVLMPIAFAAAIHAVDSGRTGLGSRLGARFGSRVGGGSGGGFGGAVGARLRARGVLPACVLGAVVTGVTFFTHPLHELVLPRTWSESAHARTADELLGRIPDGTTVAASNRLAAQLMDRTTVSEVCLFPRSFPPEEPPRWLIYDDTDNTDPACATGNLLEAGSDVPGYRLIEKRDGISLLQRTATPPTSTSSTGTSSTGIQPNGTPSTGIQPTG
ncbi:hypothetical protein BU197_08610 [Streptomyces sp. CBMA291]|nr:DUF2079 domain-containing protein [Streptomyces sp. CBMA370]MBD0708454.1 hypothetical protein [Streptomyces sp. CBMA291]MBD0717226.1 hypothetical protein [Streptomyces sp. CBMA370]